MIYPLVHEIAFIDPLTLFALFAESRGAVFLDSAQLRQDSGRFSFIAIDPFQILQSKLGRITVAEISFSGDPFSVLQTQLAQFPLNTHPDLPPFQGGVAGYFSYDLCHHLEELPASPLDDMEFPDLILGFYDLVLSFDHEKKRAWIFSSGYPEQQEVARQVRAVERLQWLLKKISQIETLPAITTAVCQPTDIQANFTAVQYQKAVSHVIDYILAGDIFEANISQRFKASLPKSLSPFQLYRRLRHINPAPFAAYVHFADVVLASASPERFLRVIDRRVEARPIKGTRPRGATVEQDEAFAADLLQSEKDHAENVMIVDLLRNDLSRVCRDHTVKVPRLCGLESYAAVHHLVSIVTGELCENIHVVDLLRAAFPGGSITGAPKVRAMEIIAEIEPNQRGPYCGSVGYIGFNGDMDLSITIRTFAIKNNTVTFQAGGAVVADSDPLTEYEETLTKANALRRALTEPL